MTRLFLTLLLLASVSVHAEITPNSLFQDNMVLQRNKPIAVFGKATSERNVSITFKNKEYLAKVNNGYWKVFLDESEAGGPFTLILKGENEITLSNILVGEVWLCSGQSNMKMPLKGNSGQPINGSNTAILKSNNPQLRLFTVKQTRSDEPFESCVGEWQSSKPSVVKNFSATAYFYGRMLQETLDVPVGLICSAWGGTPAEAWTPEEVLNSQFKDFKWPLIPSKPHRDPTVLYNGMIHPLIPFTIKGAIWYQGEGNKTYHENYTKLFSAMIKSWRDRWGQGDFPFYFVQIAPFGFGGDNQAYLREKQLKTLLTVPNTGMAVTLDIGERLCIHPAEKQKVGERLALWSLAKDYGFTDIQYSGPVYKSLEIKGNKAYVSFDYADLGLSTFGKELTSIRIAGNDKMFYNAQYKILRNGTLEVWSSQVENPVAVRYGWEQYVDGALYNTAGLPASSFRTDTWDDYQVVKD